MSQVAYEVVDLVKRYRGRPAPANDGISLTIRAGEVFGLLGANGAGKTTLVRQLAGLTRPTSGQIRLFGHDIVRNPGLASRWIAMQPQGMSLPAQVPPRELLAVTGQLRGLPPAEARRQAEALLEEFGLRSHATQPYARLSGGLRRLLAIATALIGNRPVIILDEPTNDLDPEVRRTVWRRIRRCAAGGATVILVTHNVVEAEQALDRVAILREGRVLTVGTPGELKARVARQVRLELLFRPEATEAAPGVLAGLSAYPLGRYRYVAAVPQREAEGVLARLMPHLHLLEDFRVMSASLEDVYLELTGGASLGA